MELSRARVPRAPVLVALVVAPVVATVLAGCSSPAGGPGTPTVTSGPGAPVLSAVLYQSRMDVDDRQVQVKVRNAGGGDVVVERMTFVSSAFEDPMEYRKRGSVLADGRAVDMPVVLSDPVCDGTAGRHTVRVDYRLEDGTTGTVELAADDEHGAVADLHAAECFALDVAQVATLSVRGAPRLVDRDGVLTAELGVDVTSTGGEEAALRVLHLGGTTLLQHVEPATLARLPDGLAVDVRAPSAGTESFALTLVPNRCDAHAVADDKQGTRFRVRVDLDGRQGVVPLVSPAPVKVALYEFVRRACEQVAGPDT